MLVAETLADPWLSTGQMEGLSWWVAFFIKRPCGMQWFLLAGGNRKLGYWLWHQGEAWCLHKVIQINDQHLCKIYHVLVMLLSQCSVNIR